MKILAPRISPSLKSSGLRQADPKPILATYRHCSKSYIGQLCSEDPRPISTSRQQVFAFSVSRAPPPSLSSMILKQPPKSSVSSLWTLRLTVSERSTSPHIKAAEPLDIASRAGRRAGWPPLRGCHRAGLFSLDLSLDRVDVTVFAIEEKSVLRVVPSQTNGSQLRRPREQVS